MLREIKPRNPRTARLLKEKTEPKLHEDRKRVLLLHGTKCPLPLHTVLKTISSLTKPHSILLHKKNENIHPFENVESLEFLTAKNDASLFCFGSSSKKRPCALTVGRMFDGRLLDMVELLMVGQASAEGKDTGKQMQIGVEMKPMVLFAGNVWDDGAATEQAAKFRTVKSLLLDVFQGEEIPSIDVEGLQYLMMVAASEPESDDKEPVICVRWYKLRTRKSGHAKLPRVEVDPVGPSVFDFKIGRIKEADPAVWKEAMKKASRPNENPKKWKNIDMDIMGDKVGRVHLGRQDLKTLQTRKMKGLKGRRDDDDDDDVDEDMEIGDDEKEDFDFSGEEQDEGEDGEDGIELIADGDSVDGMDVDDMEEQKGSAKKARLH